ncbi:MAG: hypothetical protein A2Y57_04105, partial [Candidatus Woykebacteria bacterium RBG_13_40_7b]
MILPLTKNTDPVWKKKFENVAKITPEIRKLINEMKETLEFVGGGVGLAAPQVGSPLRLFIVDYLNFKEVFVNPELRVLSKELIENEEGCFSVPGFRGVVPRSKRVEIKYLNLQGEKKKLTASGFLARILQHEYDHLSSTFYFQRIIDKKQLFQIRPIKIVFFGTPPFSVTILRKLIGNTIVGDLQLSLVVTSPDKQSGRNQKPTPSPVKELALKYNLKVETPENLKDKSFISSLSSLTPDLIVLASYGKIVPKEILDIPKFGSLNVHPSLLPKYRGPSPIQTAILNGDEGTGVSIMLMEDKVDSGPILAQVRIKISENDTYETLSKKLSEQSGRFLVDTIYLYLGKRVKPESQDESQATYTKLIKKEDGFIDLAKPPKKEVLERMTRAYYPWPGVWTRLPATDGAAYGGQAKHQGKILKFLPDRKVQLE